jgi:hypothetical protein
MLLSSEQLILPARRPARVCAWLKSSNHSTPGLNSLFNPDNEAPSNNG